MDVDFVVKMVFIKLICNRFLNRVTQVMQQEKIHTDDRRFNHVWIKKRDLYCHGAYTTGEPGNASKERLLNCDSDCSRNQGGVQSERKNMKYLGHMDVKRLVRFIRC